MHKIKCEGLTGPVVVGLSGGADSVALLAAMSAIGLRCIAAHCNFRLRGAESERDRSHARAIALRLGARWRETAFDTETYCRNNGLGLEEGCRKLRYEWFEQVRREENAEAIAVGHHREDQAETFFINLLRGSGLRGLCGMPAARGRIVRPLLDVSKAEILDFLRRNELDYITDSSNLEDDFTRNRVRHHVIPALRDAAVVDADRAVAASMSHLAESRRLLDFLVEERVVAYRCGDRALNVAALAGEPLAGALLYEALAPQGFSRAVTDSILASADKSGLRFRSSSGEWVLDRGVLRPAKSCDSAAQTAHSPTAFTQLEVTELSPDGFIPVRDAGVMYLDADSLPDEQIWELRPWRKGDRLSPFGMKGTRLVSDILSDAKVPIDEKASVKVLTLNGELLWVAGFRASRHYPVTSATRRIVRIRDLSDRD